MNATTTSDPKNNHTMFLGKISDNPWADSSELGEDTDTAATSQHVLSRCFFLHFYPIPGIFLLSIVGIIEYIHIQRHTRWLPPSKPRALYGTSSSLLLLVLVLAEDNALCLYITLTVALISASHQK